MFGLFGKKKTKLEKMKAQYEALQEESYKLSHTDREASVRKLGEAEALWTEIEKLSKQESDK